MATKHLSKPTRKTKRLVKKTEPMPSPGPRSIAAHQPTPDKEKPNDIFLYRHGKQIGLNWDLIRHQHETRRAEEMKRSKAESTLPKPIKKAIKKSIKKPVKRVVKK